MLSMNHGISMLVENQAWKHNLRLHRHQISNSCFSTNVVNHGLMCPCHDSCPLFLIGYHVSSLKNALDATRRSRALPSRDTTSDKAVQHQILSIAIAYPSQLVAYTPRVYYYLRRTSPSPPTQRSSPPQLHSRKSVSSIPPPPTWPALPIPSALAKDTA